MRKDVGLSDKKEHRFSGKTVRKCGAALSVQTFSTAVN